MARIARYDSGSAPRYATRLVLPPSANTALHRSRSVFISARSVLSLRGQLFSMWPVSQQCWHSASSRGCFFPADCSVPEDFPEPFPCFLEQVATRWPFFLQCLQKSFFGPPLERSSDLDVLLGSPTWWLARRHRSRRRARRWCLVLRRWSKTVSDIASFVPATGSRYCCRHSQ